VVCPNGDARASRRRTFDEIADLYDRYRPSYPERLVDDVVAFSGIHPDGRILEIGCGTGQLTRLFARRGFSIRCVELGANLARLAERNCAEFGRVRIEVSSFEEWPAPAAEFDLVVAAQSFHHVDPAIGFAKSARALKSRAALALVTSVPQRDTSDAHAAVQEVYKRHAPSLAEGAAAGRAAALEDQIDATGLFDSAVVTRYQWSRTYDAQAYAGLMETQSDNRLLPAEQRAALLEGIGDVIVAFGGAITVEYVTRLCLAKKAL
jgi:SAM-dependent methyltransferase